MITIAGETLMIDNPVKLPNESEIERIEEPVIQATLHLPQEFLGGVLKICEEKRGTQKEIRYLGPKRVMLVYELPLNEIVVDFYDRLKSVSRGYASMDYELAGYRPADLVKLDVRINGDVVDAMSMIVHSGEGLLPWPRSRAENARADSAPAFRSRHPSRHRQPDDVPRIGEGAAQKCHREMLRRRYHAQAQTAGAPERRQEAHETGRQSGNTSRGVSRGAQSLVSRVANGRQKR